MHNSVATPAIVSARSRRRLSMRQRMRATWYAAIGDSSVLPRAGSDCSPATSTLTTPLATADAEAGAWPSTSTRSVRIMLISRWPVPARPDTVVAVSLSVSRTIARSGSPRSFSIIFWESSSERSVYGRMLS